MKVEKIKEGEFSLKGDNLIEENLIPRFLQEKGLTNNSFADEEAANRLAEEFNQRMNNVKIFPA